MVYIKGGQKEKRGPYLYHLPCLKFSLKYGLKNFETTLSHYEG